MPSASAPARPVLPPVRLRAVLGLVGAAAALVALGVVWAARLSVGRPVYVSELGSGAHPTTAAFAAALLLLAGGGAAAALAARGERATAAVLRAGSVTASLATSSVAFVVAAGVPCSPGCPVPFTSGSTAQDAVHVTAAVLGFAAAVWAMLQAVTAAPSRAVRRVSVVAAVLVAVAAAAGGLLSLLGVDTDLGAQLELLATTVAVGWLVVHAASAAVPPRLRRRPDPLARRGADPLARRRRGR